MAKQNQEYIDKLREAVKPGDTLYTVLRNVSSSGMSRRIDVYKLEVEDGKIVKRWFSYWIAQACGLTFSKKHECIVMSGCGTDMGFEIVYNLGRVLFPNGFECTGSQNTCHANDHSNGDRSYEAGAHKPVLNGQCDVCHHYGDDCTGATASHPHKDGGYSLKQEWI